MKKTKNLVCRISESTSLEINKYAAAKKITRSAAITELIEKALLGESEGCYAKQIQQAVGIEVNRLLAKMQNTISISANAAFEERCDELLDTIENKNDKFKQELLCYVRACLFLLSDMASDNTEWTQEQWLDNAMTNSPNVKANEIQIGVN